MSRIGAVLCPALISAAAVREVIAGRADPPVLSSDRPKVAFVSSTLQLRRCNAERLDRCPIPGRRSISPEPSSWKSSRAPRTGLNDRSVRRRWIRGEGDIASSIVPPWVLMTDTGPRCRPTTGQFYTVAMRLNVSTKRDASTSEAGASFGRPKRASELPGQHRAEVAGSTTGEIPLRGRIVHDGAGRFSTRVSADFAPRCTDSRRWLDHRLFSDGCAYIRKM